MSNSRLDKRFDAILLNEEAGLLGQQKIDGRIQKILNNKLALFGIVVFAIITLASIFAPLICRYDPLMVDLRAILRPPGGDHLLGTDKVGRDVFSRIVYGGRISILVGLGSALGAALIGVTLGCYAGYRGGWLDKSLLRVSEVFMAFPQIILVWAFRKLQIMPCNRRAE